MSSTPSTITMSLMLLLTACTVTKPVAPAPTSASVQEYLARYPHAILRITDSTGHGQWIYDAHLQGDTLRGLRNTTMPRDSIAMPLRQQGEIAAPHFSATRTFVLLAGLAAVVGVDALLLPRPLY